MITLVFSVAVTLLRILNYVNKFVVLNHSFKFFSDNEAMSDISEPISAQPAYGYNVIGDIFNKAAPGPAKDPLIENARILGFTPREGDFSNNEGRSIYIRGYGKTSASDSRPVLGTSGMGPCLGVAIYNPEQKTGAIAHFDTRTDLSSLDKLIEDMGIKNHKLEVHLAGGDETSEHSRNMVGQIIKKLNSYENVQIKSADIMGPSGNLRSLALDTRSGQVYSRFMGSQLDKGENPQAIMSHHASTAYQLLPLRPEYIDGKSFVPQEQPTPGIKALDR